MFDSCCGQRSVNQEVNPEEPENCMKRYFFRRSPRSRTKRRSGTGKKGENTRRNVNTLTRKEEALATLKKMPAAPDLTVEMNKIIYQSPFSSVEHDVLRLIRRVTVEKRNKGNLVHEISLAKEENDVPDELTEHNDRSCYLLKVLLSLLVDHFENEETASDYNSALEAVINSGDISVLNLINAVGGGESMSARVVRCLHQGVVITGVTFIKCSVCPLATKDMAQNATGWGIKITLDDYIQVRQTRREVSALKKDGLWEIEFDISLTFPRQMTELTSVKLNMTDLDVSQVTDAELKEYLQEAFGNGNLVLY